MKVNFFLEDIASLKILKYPVRNVIKIISSEEKIIFSDINIIFCSDNYLLDINKQYLNHDFYTDIITFDYKNVKSISSDIFISIDRVTENALLHNVAFLNELHRIIIHGILHLCGYEDDTAQKKHKMSIRENYFLTFFK